MNKNLAIGGVGALGTIVSVVSGVVYSRGSGMPACTLLWLESEFDKNYPEPKEQSKSPSAGLFMAWYLTGTYGVENGELGLVNNKDWWEWSYERWKQDINEGKVLSDEFKEESRIKFGYAAKDSVNTEGLNRHCEVIYKKDFNEILKGRNEVSDPLIEETKLKSDLFRYCSPLGSRPLTIYKTQEQTYPKESNFYASDTNNSYSFVSVTDSRNNLFWDLRTDEFFGNKKKFSEPESQPFKDLYKQKDNPNRGNLKEVCGEEYLKVDPSTTSDLTLQDLQMHCTILGL